MHDTVLSKNGVNVYHIYAVFLFGPLHQLDFK